MEFVLAGFRQDLNIRRFAFEGVTADRKRKRTEFFVGVDLTLIRKYSIPMQELPLLCRHLLADLTEVEQGQTLMFTEKDMVSYATRRVAAQAAADQKRKAHRRPPSNRVGQAWRSQAGTPTQAT
jgi:hypothetical protein